MTETISNLKTFAYDSGGITVDATAGGVRLTLANVRATPPAQKVFITVEAAQIRYTTDGVTAPTSTEGHVANVGDIIELDNRNDIENFRAIRTGGTSATLRVSYKR